MARTSDVEVILVGNELLKGERRDAHLSFVGQTIATVGLRIGGAHVVGDDIDQISRLIKDRLDDTRVMIVSGGLGPTHDDVTREGVAAGLDLPLEFDESEWQTIQKIFEGFGRAAGDSNRKQAYFPKNATPIPNPNGTAAGFWVETNHCTVFVLPGPPKELNPMLETNVLPELQSIFGRAQLFTRTFRTTGIGESAMTPKVQPIFDRFDMFEVSSLPHVGGVDIVITGVERGGDFEGYATQFEDSLHQALGKNLYATGTTSLEAVIGEALATSGATLAIAESLTGGLIGKRITDVTGSSRYLLADAVTYSNDSKVVLLGVDKKTLERDGAVSESVCREMMAGIREKTGATFALATTGIAGPGGGSDEKPVGLCYFGICWDGGAMVKKRVFPGSRDDVRSRVTYATLFLLYDKLLASR